MDGDQVATMDEDFVDRLGDPILEVLDLDFREMQLLVLVHQIREPVSSKPDPAEHSLVQAVGDEPNEGRVGDGVRLEDFLRRVLEDQEQATRRRSERHQAAGSPATAEFGIP
jgi:hypothetical protein